MDYRVEAPLQPHDPASSWAAKCWVFTLHLGAAASGLAVSQYHNLRHRAKEAEHGIVILCGGVPNVQQMCCRTSIEATDESFRAAPLCVCLPLSVSLSLSIFLPCSLLSSLAPPEFLWNSSPCLSLTCTLWLVSVTDLIWREQKEPTGWQRELQASLSCCCCPVVLMVPLCCQVFPGMHHMSCSLPIVTMPA